MRKIFKKSFILHLVVALMCLTGCGSTENNTVGNTVGNVSEENIVEPSETSEEALEENSAVPSEETEEDLEEETQTDDDPYSNTISEAAKEKAAAFPDVSGDLPDWKGTHIVDKAEFAWPWVIVEPDPERVTESTIQETWYDEETVLEIAEAGYSFVRVSIDTRFFFTEEEYLALPYVGSDFYGDIDIVNIKQYKNLDELIEWCIENDIHVCLDCHSTPGGLMIGGDEEASREELFTPESEAQKLFVRFWSIIAQRYADVDSRALSFNLYNEPPTFASENEEIYINLMNDAIAQIQTYSPERLIIVDAMNYSTAGIDNVDALEANNLVIGFHLYANESAWTEPGAKLDLNACKTEVSERLNYYNTWASENNVRWMLQEYGCATYIRQDEQESYYRMIIDACKSMGIPYSLWAFNAGDFGLCIWAEGNKFDTPDAVYEETCAGHRINKALADLTTE